MHSDDQGPLCASCGCYMAEHQREMDHDWRLVHGRCLTCDCPEFDSPEDIESPEVAHS